jgi:hypothetical protein
LSATHLLLLWIFIVERVVWLFCRGFVTTQLVAYKDKQSFGQPASATGGNPRTALAMAIPNETTQHPEFTQAGHIHYGGWNRGKERTSWDCLTQSSYAHKHKHSLTPFHSIPLFSTTPLLLLWDFFSIQPLIDTT